MLYPSTNCEQYAEKSSTTLVGFKTFLPIIRIGSHMFFFVAETMVFLVVSSVGNITKRIIVLIY